MAKWLCRAALLLSLAGCGGGGGGDGGDNEPSLRAQTISFAESGPLATTVGSVITNTASGGDGAGAITYSVDNTDVAVIDATSGQLSAVGVGTATVTATKAASAGYSSATASYVVNVTAGDLTFRFDQAGPLNKLVGLVFTNSIRGGRGTGAVTYVSDNPSVAAVDSTTGEVTLHAQGSAEITATKAADADNAEVQVSYTVNVASEVNATAWLGGYDGAEFTFPAVAEGALFARSSDPDCNPANINVCADGESDILSGQPVYDRSRYTSGGAGYQYLVTDTKTSQQVIFNQHRFSPRIGHGAVFFNERYWVISGGRTAGAVNYVYSDIWTSADGVTWDVVSYSPAFGARWFHQLLVYNNKMWLLGSGAVYSSDDGEDWTEVAAASPFTRLLRLNAAAFAGAMWAVYEGTAYSSTDGQTWVQESALGAAGGIREHATLTVFDNRLWLIGGDNGTSTTNDVWTSTDGINWNQQPAPPFLARAQHTSFVLNGELWVFGGTSMLGGGEVAAIGDAWYTVDGVSWQESNNDHVLDRATFAKAVVADGAVLLIGGVRNGFSDKVWRSTNALNWTELSPFAPYSPRIGKDVAVFNNELWVVGGVDQYKGALNEVWHSNDGVNWSQALPSTPIFAPTSSHRITVFNNRLWVVGGWDGDASSGGSETRTNAVWSSADGINWMEHTPTGAIFSPRINHELVVLNNRLWLIGGQVAGDVAVADVWSTADGEAWIEEAGSAAFGPRHNHQVVSFNNAMWLFGGADDSTSYNDVWTTTDGLNWTEVNANTGKFTPRVDHQVVVHDNRMWLVGGVDRRDYLNGVRRNDVWSTTDGANWTEETVATQFDARYYHRMVTYAGELWMLGGFDLSAYNDVWRSTNGIDWLLGYRTSFNFE